MLTTWNNIFGINIIITEVCSPLNLNEIDPACGQLASIRGAGRIIKTNHVMTNNFAFGGINSSIIFKRWEL
ncbi:MAG: hypothetical protein HRT53_19930 [Colwellia sp.]|nr:hypothetical protein [Colwellia sp.]